MIAVDRLASAAVAREVSEVIAVDRLASAAVAREVSVAIEPANDASAARARTTSESAVVLKLDQLLSISTHVNGRSRSLLSVIVVGIN